MSLCVFLCLVSARLHEHYAGVRGPALPGLWGAADQLFITAEQILASLQGSRWGTEEDRGRETKERSIFHQFVSKSYVPTQMVYTLSPVAYVLAKRVLAFVAFNHRFCLFLNLD